MKKWMVFGASLIAILFILLFSNLACAVRINEVELNPYGSDRGNEWVELYSEEEVNLSGWRLVNSDNKAINLSQKFNGYLIISFSGQWLDNSDESLKLYNGLSLVDSASQLEDGYNNEKTWQYCNGKWNFTDSTKSSSNSCSSQTQTPTQNTTQNNTNQQQEAEIYLGLDWDEDNIVNGEEFEIEVNAFNLESGDYDIKIYITFEENETILSEIYDEKDDDWKSSSYYINEILTGQGNKSETFNLRIKSSYGDFYGDAEIKAKIRKFETSSVIAELKEDIEILENREAEEEGTAETNSTSIPTTTSTPTSPSIKQTGSVIKLGRDKTQEQADEAVKAEQENQQDKALVIYESASEKMKKYAIYALNIILIVIIILLIKKKV